MTIVCGLEYKSNTDYNFGFCNSLDNELKDTLVHYREIIPLSFRCCVQFSCINGPVCPFCKGYFPILRVVWKFHSVNYVGTATISVAITKERPIIVNDKNYNSVSIVHV